MGGGKKVTVGYKYYLDMHMALCHGPIDFLRRIAVDDRTALLSHMTEGEHYIDAPGLFGGESREGGIQGFLELLFGGGSQLQNAYLQARLDPDVPAFRGVVSVILKDMYMSMNPYLKPWKFGAQRIHVRQNGIAQWYDAKSAIPVVTAADLEKMTPVEIEVDSRVNGMFPVYTGSPPALRVYGFDPTATYLVEIRADGDWIAWSKWDSDSNGLALGNPWGTEICVTRAGGDGGTQFEGGPWRPTKEEAFAAFTPFTITGASYYDFWFKDAPLNDNRQGLSLKITQISDSELYDMNPAHIIRECLTDPDWGMGYLETDIDDTSFEDAADRLYAELMGMSLLWDRQIPIEQFIKEVIKHINAALYVDRQAGKFVLKLIRDDYDLGTILSLGEDDISNVENPVRPVFGELPNSVSVVYWDTALDRQASLTVQDPALIAAEGTTINTTVQYPGFTNSRTGAIAGARDLRVLSAQLLSCTIYANRKAARLNQGDVFKFTWPKLNIYNMVMRVTEIALGNGKSNRVRIKAIQDVFATPDTAPVADPTGGGWVDPSAPPTAALYRKVAEAPYLELVQVLGQSDADGRLTSNPDIGFIAASAVRPGSAINAVIAVDSGAGYEESGYTDFCPSATIANDISKTIETFDIENPVELSDVEIGTYAVIDNEIVRVDAISDTSITCGRGCLDTVPQLHSAGARLFFLDIFQSGDGIEYVSGESINVKLLPVTGVGVLPLASANADTVLMASRAIRPYPPGQFKIEGAYYPTGVQPETVTVSWVHRDRSQQTGGTILDFTDAGVGPETGTTYRIQVLDLADNVVIEITGISGTSQAVNLSTMPGPIAKLRLYAERDGYLSAQPHEHTFEFEYTGHTFVVVGGDYVLAAGDYVVKDTP